MSLQTAIVELYVQYWACEVKVLSQFDPALYITVTLCYSLLSRSSLVRLGDEMLSVLSSPVTVE